jgi:hypothetical protein
MVAWHEMPGRQAITVPSRKERYDLWFCRQFLLEAPPFPVVNQGQCFRPYPTGRIHGVGVSRHFVPRYLLTVPPGQFDGHN